MGSQQLSLIGWIVCGLSWDVLVAFRLSGTAPLSLGLPVLSWLSWVVHMSLFGLGTSHRIVHRSLGGRRLVSLIVWCWVCLIFCLASLSSLGRPHPMSGTDSMESHSTPYISILHEELCDRNRYWLFQYYVRFGTISNLGRFTGRHARKQACCTSLAMQRDSFSCRRARTQYTYHPSVLHDLQPTMFSRSTSISDDVCFVHNVTKLGMENFTKCWNKASRP